MPKKSCLAIKKTTNERLFYQIKLSMGFKLGGLHKTLQMEAVCKASDKVFNIFGHVLTQLTAACRTEVILLVISCGSRYRCIRSPICQR